MAALSIVDSLEQVRKAEMAHPMVQTAMEGGHAAVAVVVWAARRRHLPAQGQMVVQVQPTRSQERHTLLPVAAVLDLTVKVV